MHQFVFLNVRNSLLEGTHTKKKIIILGLGCGIISLEHKQKQSSVKRLTVAVSELWPQRPKKH